MSSLLLASLLLLLGSLWSFLYIFRRHGRKLPPGPRGLPLIGNLHMLGTLPHQSLYHLAQKYGPIMSIRLGGALAVVISSPEAAELVLKTHDLVFASRPKLQAVERVGYNTKGIAFQPYGSYWRSIRKLVTLQLLSASKVEFFAPLRRTELGSLVASIQKAVAAREVVNLSEKVKELNEDIMYKMILGRSKDERFKLKEIIKQGVNLAGAFNIADYLPFLGPLDLQGLNKKFTSVGKAVDEVLEKIIQEHEQDSQEKEKQHRDLVDELLSLQNQTINAGEDKQEFVIDRPSIKAITLDMLAAAFDNSATVIEWALAEVLRHPHVRLRLQEEMERVVGKSRVVEETHLSELTYLDMVVKETLRLHPVAPLLIPHQSREDLTINGYFIPKKSIIFVNVWAIGRDPGAWVENIEEFNPERFSKSSVDLKGHDFQLIPFGSGRRGCPGMHLGLTTVKLVVAQLVHCFEWELPDGMLPHEMDMQEEYGLTLPRAHPLLAKPITYRLA